MKYVLYEDPHTHRFALVPVSADETVSIPATARWFDTREQALHELLDQEEVEPGVDIRDPEQVSGTGRPH